MIGNTTTEEMTESKRTVLEAAEAGVRTRVRVTFDLEWDDDVFQGDKEDYPTEITGRLPSPKTRKKYPISGGGSSEHIFVSGDTEGRWTVTTDGKVYDSPHDGRTFRGMDQFVGSNATVEIL